MEIKSEFHNIIIGLKEAALEWSTVVTSLDGKQLHYTGVTLLEMDGSRITRSFAYFDPGAFGCQLTIDGSE